MASKSNTCSGCRTSVAPPDYIRCCKCENTYDLECANISPKSGNINTPVRNVKDGASQSISESRQIQDNDTVNITTRNKRKRLAENSSAAPDHTDDSDLISAISMKVLKAIRLELPSMFTQILKTELATFTNELQDLRNSVEFLSGMHDGMKVTSEKLANDNISLKNENTILKTSVQELSDRLNNIEQHLRENNLELHGVSEHRNENLPLLIQQCSNIIGHKLNEGDAINCTRVSKLNKESKQPRTIVTKFKNLRSRDEFYSAVYRYNKANPNEKLNTALLGLAGEKKPVYVSEHLSPANKNLHAAARLKAREFSYKFVWVRNGRIYVRRNPEAKLILIKNKNSLDLIR